MKIDINEDSTFFQTIDFGDGILIDVRRFNIDVHALARINLEQALQLFSRFRETRENGRGPKLW